MFKITAEAFVSSKFYQEHTHDETGTLYINTQLGSKYTNPHTKEVSYDNLRILLKGNIGEAWKESIQARDLVSVEGILHERTYVNKAGVKVYYNEMTVHTFRKLELRPKKLDLIKKKEVVETSEVEVAPTMALPENVLKAIAASLTPEQLAVMMQNA